MQFGFEEECWALWGSQSSSSESKESPLTRQNPRYRDHFSPVLCPTPLHPVECAGPGPEEFPLERPLPLPSHTFSHTCAHTAFLYICFSAQPHDAGVGGRCLPHRETPSESGLEFIAEDLIFPPTVRAGASQETVLRPSQRRLFCSKPRGLRGCDLKPGRSSSCPWCDYPTRVHYDPASALVQLACALPVRPSDHRSEDTHYLVIRLSQVNI